MKDHGFKFKMDALVSPMLVRAWTRPRGDRETCMGHVVSRILEDCPGGVQRHYHVRLFHDGYPPSVARDLTKFSEVELVKYVPPKKPKLIGNPIKPKKTTRRKTR